MNDRIKALSISVSFLKKMNLKKRLSLYDSLAMDNISNESMEIKDDDVDEAADCNNFV